MYYVSYSEIWSAYPFREKRNTTFCENNQASILFILKYRLVFTTEVTLNTNYNVDIGSIP